MFNDRIMGSQSFFNGPAVCSHQQMETTESGKFLNEQ